MKLRDYFFGVPDNGNYLKGLAVILTLAAVAALISYIVSRRSSYAVVRRRARQLRSICWWLAFPGALYVLARYNDVGWLSRRFLIYLVILVFAVRLIRWLLDLRSLTHDKVEENQRKRKQTYFKRRRSRPAKRRRRR